MENLAGQSKRFAAKTAENVITLQFQSQIIQTLQIKNYNIK
jgi:hypothetical protein